MVGDDQEVPALRDEGLPGHLHVEDAAVQHLLPETSSAGPGWPPGRAPGSPGPPARGLGRRGLHALGRLGGRRPALPSSTLAQSSTVSTPVRSPTAGSATPACLQRHRQLGEHQRVEAQVRRPAATRGRRRWPASASTSAISGHAASRSMPPLPCAAPRAFSPDAAQPLQLLELLHHQLALHLAGGGPGQLARPSSAAP